MRNPMQPKQRLVLDIVQNFDGGGEGNFKKTLDCSNIDGEKLMDGHCLSPHIYKHCSALKILNKVTV